MSHEELADLYELYALGVLDREESAEIEEHLARACPECGQGLRRALGLNAFLATAAEPAEPPKRLRRRIRASVGPRPLGRGFFFGAWAFASACLIILLAISAVDNRRRGEELSDARNQLRRVGAQLATVQAALQLLNQPETRQVVFGAGQPQPPRGRVFVNVRQGVLLLASNLPPAAAGRTYEMWLIPKGGAPKPAGLFQSDADGNALYVLNGPVDPATSVVAVTDEPAAGSAAPTTKPIIVAALSD
jgi:anti-sigma-K factor RskA